MNPKMALAGHNRHETLLYGGVAVGVLAGAALSTYVWRWRVRAAIHASPAEKADKMIEACEKKLESIEAMMRDLQSKSQE